MTNYSRPYRDYLAGLNIPFDYLATTCVHNLGCLDAEGINSAAFIAKNFSPTTGVEADAATLPQAFTLQQNYPNPFSANGTFGNPSTVISFQLPASSHVTLKVFDVNGREVATLVDGEMAAGKHAVTFSSPDLAGGLYFYKITAGKFSQTRKAVLMK